MESFLHKKIPRLLGGLVAISELLSKQVTVGAGSGKGQNKQIIFNTINQ